VIPAADPSASPASLYSTVLERTLEHRFLADLSAFLWCRGIYDFAVSKSEVDQYGYDLIVEVGAVIRHVQLKSKARASATARTSANLRLAAKPSGCIVWMVYDPATLLFDHFLWFGGLPGMAMPPLGDKATRHTKRDATGVKKERPGHRSLAIGMFARVDSMPLLAHRLFGPLVD
jgi:hypothetical protein